MHLMAERDEARGIRREDERVERTVEGIDVLTFDDETVFTWSGVVTRCWKCGDEVELITEELVDGKAPDKYLCAECDG